MTTCTKCKIEKDESMFAVIKDGNSGNPYRIARCKKCCSDYNNELQKRKRANDPEWRQIKSEQGKLRLKKLKEENPDKYNYNKQRHREYYNKIYYPNNKEKVLIKTKKYREGSEKDKARRKKYQEENREYFNEVKRNYRKNMSDRYVVSLLLNSERRQPYFSKELYQKFNPKYLIELHKINLTIKRQIYGNPKEKNQKHEGLD